MPESEQTESAPSDGGPPSLSDSARLVLGRRYLQRDDSMRIVETPDELFRRVATSVAQAESSHGATPEALANDAYALMSKLEFLPNSPTLMNAGTESQQLAACFVLPVEDSLTDIFDTLKYAALIHQSGGGTGFAFSHLRPANDIVHSTHGVASGPVSFMHVFDAATDAIKQGGKRRGANMAILQVDHPDIDAFIQAKAKKDALKNFNLSVAVTDAFMEAVEAGADYDLINPRTGEAIATRPAAQTFDLLVQGAWATGDPGVVFSDRINADNPTPALGPIESTNPCGEQPLLPHESCTLGSINVSRFVAGAGTLEEPAAELDWERLGSTIDTAVQFLDDVIDTNHYPSERIADVTRSTRKIGLGVMGFADLLYRLRLPYDSQEALDCADGLMQFVAERANQASARLGRERGTFLAWPESIYAPDGPTFRNATRTTIAPTGTLSIIASCSSGVEPIFALAFIRRHYLDEDDPSALTELTEVNPIFRAIATAQGWWSDDLQAALLHGGSLGERSDAPADAKRVFVTAHDIAPEWHVRMQATFQRHVDNAVSKTINFPRDASADEIAGAYRLAWREGCKGITVYRDRSQPNQVLSRRESELDLG